MKKTFIALGLCVFSTTVFAGAFAPLEKAGFDEKSFPKFYEFKVDCEKVEKSACYDIEECPTEKCILIDEVDEIGVYTGKKLLRNSPVKIEALEAAKQAEKDAKEAKKAIKLQLKADLDAVDWSASLTNAQLKAILKKKIQHDME